jgi:hypothetical protein
MTYSLTTSTAPSMRADGALAQLARGDDAVHREADGWFGQSTQHDPYLGGYNQSSLPARVGLGIAGIDGSNTFPRLGSPFAARPRPSVLNLGNLRPPSPSRTQFDGPSMLGPHLLRSPLQLASTLPLPPALKRRAQPTIEDTTISAALPTQHNLFEGMFGAPADSSHRRVRSRGFSLGDVSEGSRLASIVTPPTIYDQMDSSDLAATTTSPQYAVNFSPSTAFLGPSSSSSLHSPAPLQRLGSPFGGVDPPLAGPAHGPSQHVTTQAYDPFISGQRTAPLPQSHEYGSVAPSIEERLAQLRDEECGRSKRMRG